MGVIIPQVVTEDKVGGAQVIDGSLRFDSDKLQRLEKTFGTPTDNDLFTWSFWIKLGSPITGSSDYRVLVEAYTGSNDQYNSIAIQNGKIVFNQDEGSGGTMNETTNAVFRDPNSWYNIVVAVDISNGTASNKLKIYVNGTEQSYTPANTISSEIPYLNKASTAHRISARWSLASSGCFDGLMSQVYLIDGQALTPSLFGYTDPLTNTWRPKKYTGTYGNNGFYLPMDGNTPIGLDQSGRGNNWTPVNFGGSNTIEKATGALPILNTDGGGKVARVGVRTDAYHSNLRLAVPFVGNTSDVSHLINGSQSQKTDTNNGSTATTTSNFYGGSRDFDGSNDTCSWSSVSALGTGDFTVEFWLKSQASSLDSVYRRIVSTGTNATSAIQIGHIGSSAASAGYITYTHSDASVYAGNSRVNVTDGNWHHVAVVRSSGVVNVYVDGQIGDDDDADSNNKTETTWYVSGYGGSTTQGRFDGQIQDLRVYNTAKYTQNFIPASTDPDILPDTPSGVAYSSNVTAITDGAVAFDGSGDNLSFSLASGGFGSGDFTLEYFVYHNTLTNYQTHFGVSRGSTGFNVGTDAAGNFVWYDYNGGASRKIEVLSAISTGRWYHWAFVRSGSTITGYLDGRSVATYSSSVNYSGTTCTIGSLENGSEYINGFISNFHITVGTALYTSNFTPPTAPITSVANTKLLCCKSNSSATAYDVSPGSITANGNAVATNFNPFTVNINTQRGQESGYCTLNPLFKSSGLTLTNGNLTVDNGSNTQNQTVLGNVYVNTGKWYAEFTKTVTGSEDGVGIAADGYALSSGFYSTKKLMAFRTGEVTYSSFGSSTFPSFTSSGDIVRVRLDLDNQKFGISVNGGPFTDVTITSYDSHTAGEYWTFCLHNGSSGGAGDLGFNANFGQKPFKFPPPAGFQPLALANTPRPTIVRPDQYMGISTWSGDNTTRNFNIGWKPDFVWIKCRSTFAGHRIFDSVRGVKKSLIPDGTYAEDADSVFGYVSSFNRDGFTLTPGTYSGYESGDVNMSGRTYVGWAWKAGGSGGGYSFWKDDIGYSTASAAGLTAGTITPTGASVNTKSGFSIIRYTGTGSAATVSHGLQNTPQFLIVKRTDTTERYWMVYHTSTGNTNRLVLNDTVSVAANSAYWNNTSPTSSVFSLGADPGNFSNSTNASGGTYISYLWAEIPGFSKFGTYTGTGSTNFVSLGFRPRWIMMKRAVVNSSPDQTNDFASWTIYDTSRNAYNGQTANPMYANKNVGEGYRGDGAFTGNFSDIIVNSLSNGFYLSGPGTEINANTGTYIYAAFAETPSFNLYGGQANAR